MEYKSLNEMCLVCGDTAFGINYSVLTCTPCKAFFRRHSWKQTIPKCNFESDCKIDPVTRKFCQSCRLKKCHDAGMRNISDAKHIDAVNSSGEYSNDEISYQDNICINNLYGNYSISSGSYSNEEIDFESMDIESYIAVNTENSFDSQTNSYESEYFSKSISCDSTNIPKSINNFEDSNTIGLNIELRNYVSEQEFRVISCEDRKRFEEYDFLFINNILETRLDSFTELEEMKIVELLNATELLKREYSVNLIIDSKDYWSTFAICSAKLEDEVKNIVKMSKMLPGFNCLCDEDKIILLKYSAPEIIFMRSINDFDYNQRQWNIVLQNGDSSSLKMEFLKVWNKNIYDLSEIYLTTMTQYLDPDNAIMAMLTAIVLLNPDRQALINSEVVRHQQYVYMYLLQRYLQMNYCSENEIKGKFFRLMKSIQILNMISKKFTQNLIEDNYKLFNMIKYFGPLIREIYDIN